MASDTKVFSTRVRPMGESIACVGRWAALAVLLSVVAGCNTTEGVGKDVESAGEGIKEAAQDAKN